MKHLLLALLFTSLAAVACSSGDDDGGGDDDDDSTTGSSGSPQSGSSGSNTKAECQNIDDCQKLSCTCGGFSGAEVQKCNNGVCAKSCEEAGCD